jgi:hypothetical protein
VGVGVSSVTRGNRALVVFGAVLLCTAGTGGFLCFTEFGMVAVTLAVMTFRGWGLGEVF